MQYERQRLKTSVCLRPPAAARRRPPAGAKGQGYSPPATPHARGLRMTPPAAFFLFALLESRKHLGVAVHLARGGPREGAVEGDKGAAVNALSGGKPRKHAPEDPAQGARGAAAAAAQKGS